MESQHSFRSTSSSSQGPPHGQRVVLGRETSPVPLTGGQSGQQDIDRLPAEITNKFSGQTREVTTTLLLSVPIQTCSY